MPRLSSLRRAGPVGLALTAYDLWRRLPPKQPQQLLKAMRKHGRRVLVFLVPDDVVVDLPRAEDEPRDLVAVRGRVVEYRQKGPLCEVNERRRRLLEPKQAFRSHHDQRPRCGRQSLPPEQVKVL